MPIAHTCASCGHDLSRVPAPLEPVYRLPMVMCPACRTPVVRRSDGHRLVPRRVRYRVVALQRLLKSSAFLGLFTIGFVAICAMLHATLEEHHINLATALFADGVKSPGAAAWRFQLGHIAFGVWLAFTLATGAYLSSAFPHLRRVHVVTLWVVLIVLILATPVMVVIRDELIHRGSLLQPIVWRRIVTREETLAATSFAQTLGTAFLLLPLGIPLGRFSRRVRVHIAAQRFRKLRRRIVTRRHRA